MAVQRLVLAPGWLELAPARPASAPASRRLPRSGRKTVRIRKGGHLADASWPCSRQACRLTERRACGLLGGLERAVLTQRAADGSRLLVQKPASASGSHAPHAPYDAATTAVVPLEVRMAALYPLRNRGTDGPYTAAQPPLSTLAHSPTARPPQPRRNGRAARGRAGIYMGRRHFTGFASDCTVSMDDARRSEYREYYATRRIQAAMRRRQAKRAYTKVVNSLIRFQGIVRIWQRRAAQIEEAAAAICEPALP